ncbi:MAG TPA: SRPBCC family protein [Acidimicrobiales bacterium]|nr:SRPBCC family protein [Acidimicrobiales bacterium]
MTTNAPGGGRLLGSLRAADGTAVVRIEDLFDADVEDVWSAITDPSRLARWFGQVEGDLRPGGEFRLHVEDADSDATGRVEACEPRRRLIVTSRETDESYQRGQGVPPFDAVIEVTLAADDDRTTLVVEVRGMPLDAIAFYGVGWQIHAENLASHLAGRERDDTEARWDQLVPVYQALAADIG